MKLIVTGLLALLSVCFSFAQIKFNPEVILLEYDDTQSYILERVSIINTGTEPVSIHWMFEKGEGFPEAWTVSIADDNLDYVPGIFKSVPNFPNFIAVNDSIEYLIRVNTDNTPGSTYCIVHIYDDADCENEIATSGPPITSIYSIESEDLILYPNPALAYFRIKNDDQVKAIEVINSLGQILKSEPHGQNEEHSILDLSKGMYIVVLRDSENRILKTSFLFKQ